MYQNSQKYMEHLLKKVETELFILLPNKFALILDG